MLWFPSPAVERQARKIQHVRVIHIRHTKRHLGFQTYPTNISEATAALLKLPTKLLRCMCPDELTLRDRHTQCSPTSLDAQLKTFLGYAFLALQSKQYNGTLQVCAALKKTIAKL